MEGNPFWRYSRGIQIYTTELKTICLKSMEDNPFWGEPTPTDVWDDMQKLDHLYEELMWDHRDKLEFAIEGNHITIRNRSREGR